MFGQSKICKFRVRKIKLLLFVFIDIFRTLQKLLVNSSAIVLTFIGQMGRQIVDADLQCAGTTAEPLFEMEKDIYQHRLNRS